MKFIMQYIYALKNIRKRYYLIPFLLFVYAATIMQAINPISRFLGYDDIVLREYIIFTINMIIANAMTVLHVILYPHATFYIQSTWLYRKIFKSTLGALGDGLTTYSNIGRNIPDDFEFRGSDGRRYTASAGYKTKTERVHDARTDFSFYFIMKFIIKDCIVRLFLHTGLFMVSPIIFLIAVPMLDRKGILQNIEKENTAYYDDFEYEGEI